MEDLFGVADARLLVFGYKEGHNGVHRALKSYFETLYPDLKENRDKRHEWLRNLNAEDFDNVVEHVLALKAGGKRHVEKVLDFMGKFATME